MKKDNNDMNDFFKNSMEQFNTLPSEEVWNTIVQRLDKGIPFYKKWAFWRTTTILIFLLLLSGSSILLYQQNTKLSEKSHNLSKLNENLSSSLDSLVQIQTAFNQNSPSKIYQVEDQSSESTSFNNTRITKNKSKYPSIGSTISKERANTSSNPILQTPVQDNLNLDVNLTEGSTGSVTNRSTIPSFSNFSPTRSQTETKSTLPSIVKNTPSLSTQGLTIKTTNEKDRGIINSIPTTNFGVDGKKSWLNKLEFSKIMQSIKSSIAIDPSFDTPKGWHWYRFGILAGVHTTWTDLSTNWDAGYTLGISNQIVLNQQLSISLDMRYNAQQYRFDIDNSNINSLIDYPNAPPPQSIQDVEVKSNYFDLPLGLIYSRPLGRNTKLIVNPAVAWQFYLPQKFEYDLGSNLIIGDIDERYFLYLGSAHMGLGIERKINADLAWQIGLWGEMGLIPLGVENRKIRMLGVKSLLVFGKS